MSRLSKKKVELETKRSFSSWQKECERNVGRLLLIKFGTFMRIRQVESIVVQTNQIDYKLFGSNIKHQAKYVEDGGGDGNTYTWLTPEEAEIYKAESL